MGWLVSSNLFESPWPRGPAQPSLLLPVGDGCPPQDGQSAGLGGVADSPILGPCAPHATPAAAVTTPNVCRAQCPSAIPHGNAVELVPWQPCWQGRRLLFVSYFNPHHLDAVYPLFTGTRAPRGCDLPARISGWAQYRAWIL